MINRRNHVDGAKPGREAGFVGFKTLFFAFLLVSLSAFSAHASATNIYLGQASSGAGNGADCADTYAYTFFNNGNNWGSGSTQIGPGTTVHLCGTWNGVPGQQWLTAQGSGVSGSPITIKFEAGTILQAPYHGIGINVSGQNYITIDGGTNGIIRNTLNGTAGNSCPGGPCAYQKTGVLVEALAVNNVEMKNLTCSDVYDTASGDSWASSNQNSMSCVQIRGSNISIDNNVIHDAGLGIDNTSYTNDSNYQIFNNNIYNVGWGLGCAGGTNVVSSYYFYGNHVHDLKLWSLTGVHENGIHCYAAGSGGIQNFYLYNNLFDGDMGTTSWTAWVYMETNCCTAPGVWSANGPGLHAWNNVTVSNLNLGNGAWAINGGTANEIYNNTFINTDTTGENGGGIAIGSHDADAATGWIIKNNAFSGGGQFYSFNSETNSVAMSNNVYANLVPAGNEAFNWAGHTSGNTNTLAAWQGICGCDSSSISSLSGALGASTEGVPSTSFLGLGKASVLASLSVGNLATLLQDTTAGDTRASVARLATWDIGAYQTGSAGQPQPPTNVSATIQ